MSQPVAAATAGATGPSPPVVVVHPIHQHAYETAAAADEAGLLRWFITGMYCTGRGVANPDRWGWLPRPVERAAGRLRARWHPEIDGRRVHTIVRYHALAAGARAGLSWLPAAGAYDLSAWATRRFDLTVARRLRRSGHRGLLHAFEGGCIRTLEAARRQGITTVLDVPSAHEWYLDTIEAEGGAVDRRMTARVRAERALADYLLAPSDYVVRCLVEHGVAPSRIVKLPYGVDPDRFAPRPATGRDGRFRVLFVGSIGFRKGVRYLLEAWRRLRRPDASLILAGPLDPEGPQLLRDHGGLRHWIGPVPRSQVQDWFAAADLFVFPTLAEGFGLVYLEAMAAGLPVVTTPNSACVVRDGVDGLVVPPRDVDALCDALRLLHGRPDLGREMGANGRRLIEAAYTWRHYRQSLTSMYRAMLARQPIGALD
jgi:starch synthase